MRAATGHKLLLVLLFAAGCCGRVIAYGHPHDGAVTGFAMFRSDTAEWESWTNEEQLLMTGSSFHAMKVVGHHLILGGTFVYFNSSLAHHMLKLDLRSGVASAVSESQGPWGFSVDEIVALDEDNLVAMGPILGLSNDIGISLNAVVQCSLSAASCSNAGAGIGSLDESGAYEGLSSLVVTTRRYSQAETQLVFSAYVTNRGEWRMSYFDVFSQFWTDLIAVAVYKPGVALELFATTDQVYFLYPAIGVLRSAMCPGTAVTDGLMLVNTTSGSFLDWCIAPFLSGVVQAAQAKGTVFLLDQENRVLRLLDGGRVVDVTYNLNELAGGPLILFASDHLVFVRSLHEVTALRNGTWLTLPVAIPTQFPVAATDNAVYFVSNTDTATTGNFWVNHIGVHENATLERFPPLLGVFAPAEISVMCGSINDFVAIGSIARAGDISVESGTVLFDSLSGQWLPVPLSGLGLAGERSCVTNGTDIALLYAHTGGKIHVVFWSSDARQWTPHALENPPSVVAFEEDYSLSPCVHSSRLYVTAKISGAEVVVLRSGADYGAWEVLLLLTESAVVNDMTVVGDLLYLVGNCQMRVDLTSGAVRPMGTIVPTTLAQATCVIAGSPDGGEQLVYIGGRFSLLQQPNNDTILASNLAGQNFSNGDWVSRVHNGLIRFQGYSLAYDHFEEVRFRPLGVTCSPFSQDLYVLSVPIQYVASLPCRHAFCFHMNYYKDDTWFPQITFLQAYKNTQAIAVLSSPERNLHDLLLVSAVFLLFVIATSVLICCFWWKRAKRSFRYIEIPNYAEHGIVSNVGALALDASIKKIELDELDMGEIIGRGGQGVVRQAIYKNQVVAVKSASSFRRDYFASWAQEVKLLSSMSHPNIISVYGIVVVDASELLLVEEIMDTDVLSVAPQLDAESKLEITRDLAKAMCYLHGFVPPVLHRDLKLSNLMLSRDGRVKLIDFGISRLLPDATIMELTINAGTLLYQAPETFTGVYDCKADVYSFGLLEIELWTLSPPYGSEFSGRILEFMDRVRSRELTPNLAGLASMPECPTNIIERCVEWDPLLRPTFADICSELK